MASCDMCGKEDILVVALVEGVEMNVCHKCSAYGKVLRKAVPEPAPAAKKAIVKKEPEKEMIQVIVEDYAERIKNARERRGLKQEGFAKSINEKESIIHKIETGHFEPDIILARKLERFLRINLIEQHEEAVKHGKAAKGETLTVGDLINIKKR